MGGDDEKKDGAEEKKEEKDEGGENGAKDEVIEILDEARFSFYHKRSFFEALGSDVFFFPSPCFS